MKIYFELYFHECFSLLHVILITENKIINEVFTMNESLVIHKINSNKHNLTMLEKKIAAYVLEWPSQVESSTISSLSKKIGVSEASINRFCKKIGYKGYNSFKIAIAQDNYYKGMQGKHNNTDSYIDSFFYDYKELLLTIPSIIKEETIDKVCEKITNSQQIYIISFVDTNSVALHLKNHLSLLNMSCEIYSDLFMIKLLANKCQENDLVFVINYSGKTNLLNDTLETIKQNNTPIILFTSYDSTELVKQSTESIIIPNELPSKENHYFPILIAYFSVIDFLINRLIVSNKHLKKVRIENDGTLMGNFINTNSFL